MKKKLLVLALLFVWIAGAQAQEQSQEKTKQQEDKINALMNEREQLVLEYQFYNQQNSNFWGKKSKKDLLNIIETLKKIINHDSRLVAAINEASIKKVAENTVEIQRSGSQVLADQRQIDNRIAELQSQVKTVQVQLKKRERTIKDLEMELEASKDRRYGKDRIIAILAVVAFILFAYAILAQLRLNRAQAKGRKRAR
ncbi:hypothetical protein [Botryobacter ruber]|uniref:hypothetical protein n=1 Tax=Botryobacter ruber TaxID=2171629 RepID=UPI000E0ACC22|nr:hypothetical protein [Botryobacter ruber]